MRRAIAIQRHDAPHNRKGSVSRHKRKSYVAKYFCKNHAQLADKIFLL
jgi:hypothetical protein